MKRIIFYSLLFLLVLMSIRHYIDYSVVLHEASYDGIYRPVRSTTVIDKWIENPDQTEEYYYLGKADNFEFWQWRDGEDVCHTAKHVEESFDVINVTCPPLSKVRSTGIIIEHERGEDRVSAWFPGEYPKGSVASNPLILKTKSINPDPIECSDSNPEVCASMYEYGFVDRIIDFVKEYSLIFYANYQFVLPNGTYYEVRMDRGEVLELDI